MTTPRTPWPSISNQRRELEELEGAVADAFINREEPRCIWCGKTRAEHRDAPLPSGAVPRMPCLGLKSGFYPKPQLVAKEPGDPTYVGPHASFGWDT